MYVTSSREICANECPRKEWRGGRGKMKDKEQSSKGSVDNLKTLKNRKERKGGMRDVQASSRPQKQAGDDGEHGYKGGRYVSLARSLVASSKALDMISNSTRVKSENRGQTCSRLVHVLRSELLRPSFRCCY